MEQEGHRGVASQKKKHRAFLSFLSVLYIAPGARHILKTKTNDLD